MKYDQALIDTVNAAFAAASKATKDYLATHGDRDACGFAWVQVRPANSKLAKYLKEFGGARRGSEPGVCVWNPSLNYTQAITAKEEGAYAFVKVLTDAGYTGLTTGSRMD